MHGHAAARGDAAAAALPRDAGGDRDGRDRAAAVGEPDLAALRGAGGCLHRSRAAGELRSADRGPGADGDAGAECRPPRAGARGGEGSGAPDARHRPFQGDQRRARPCGGRPGAAGGGGPHGGELPGGGPARTGGGRGVPGGLRRRDRGGGGGDRRAAARGGGAGAGGDRGRAGAGGDGERRAPRAGAGGGGARRCRRRCRGRTRRSTGRRPRGGTGSWRRGRAFPGGGFGA